MADTDIGSSEPDDESYSPDPNPLPQRKPAHAASFEDQAGDIASNMLRNSGGTLASAQLNVDHPYGDGKHGETGSDTLKRLGAGAAYSSGQ
jgi:hypothetical protein